MVVLKKGEAKKRLRLLKKIKTWQLVVLLILTGFIAATFLRLNNIGMTQRRTAVINADSAEDYDSEVVYDRLYNLQRYVTSHMNTNLGKGIFLENTYARSYRQAYEESQENPNGNIYVKVQEICRPRFSYWSQAYVQCTINELAKYPAQDTEFSPPDVNNYRHTYVSPLWSADFAGFFTLVFVVILIILIIRLSIFVILKLIIRRRQNQL